MKPQEERIAIWLHSRAGVTALCIYALLAAYVALTAGALTPVSDADKGLGLPSANLWFGPSGAAVHLFGVLANFGVAALMVYINSRFNLLRNITRLGAGLFLAIQAASPSLFCNFTTGAVMAATLLAATILLYQVFNRPGRTRPVFLIFCMIAAAALTEYAFVVYIPVFYMGCAQMRAFNIRTFVASLLGIVTPVWLATAFGFVDWSGLSPDLTRVTAQMTSAQAAHFYAVPAITAAIGATVCVLNLVKVLSYNSRARSYNGFVALLMLFTIIFGVLDFTNLPFYVTLLNVTVAWQCTQYFIINMRRRDGYILILASLAIFFALYIWSLAI